MGKIDILKFKKTSNGLIPYDSDGNKVSVRKLLQTGGMNYKNDTSNLSVLNTKVGKFSYFYGSKLDYLSVKKDKKYVKEINYSSLHKKASNNFIKSTNAPYILLKVFKYKTDKGIIRDYKYLLKEKATGNEIELDKKNVEEFFENKNWDGVDRSKRLLGGSGALVDGLIESYYAKDDSWHLRVNKNAEVVIDNSYKSGSKAGVVKDNYTLTEVYAKTITNIKGKHKLEKYAYVLVNDRTNESDLYTRDQLFNLFYDSSKSASDMYDNSRLTNASIQYYKNSSGLESYRIRVAENKVIWHIDEDIKNDNSIIKYVCTKVFRVKVPTRNGNVQNHYVEFEMLGLTKDDVEDLKNGVYSSDELSSGETFIVTGADLVALTEIIGAKEFPFYDSSKLDNLKLKNKKSSTIYDKQAEIVVYKTGGLPSTSITKLEPAVVDLDYDTWKKAHEEHVAKIEKFIKNNEDKATNTVITWDNIISNPLSDNDMDIQNSTFIDFWKNRLNSMCRIYTLPLNNDSNETAVVYDIITPDINDNTNFIVKEARTNGSMKSSSIRKFTLEGEEPADIYEALGRNWVRFLNCIANSMDRKLVLVLGKHNNKNYVISCADEEVQKKVIGNREIYYIPFVWYEEFTVKVKALNDEYAEKMVYNILNNKLNLPKQELRSVVKSSIKLDKKVLNSMKKNNATKVRPDIQSKNEEYKIKYADVDSDIFNTDEGVEIVQKEEKLNTYEIKVEIANRGYMAVDATSENEAYTVKVSAIKEGLLEFKPVSEYIPDSIKILSCELIEEYKENLLDNIDIITFEDKSWEDLDVEDENVIKLDLSHFNGEDNKNNLTKYTCRAVYQHDNQPFSEEEIKLQINSALKDVFYILDDFKCVSSEFVGNEDFPDDYLFTFEFNILASPGLDMNALISEVDSGECIDKLEDSSDSNDVLNINLTKEELDKQLLEILEAKNKSDVNPIVASSVGDSISEIESAFSWRFYNFNLGPFFVNIDGLTLEDYKNKEIFIYQDGKLVDILLDKTDELVNGFKKIDDSLDLFDEVYLDKEELNYVKFAYMYPKFKDNFITYNNLKWYLDSEEFKIDNKTNDVIRLKLIESDFAFNLESSFIIYSLDSDENYYSVLDLYNNSTTQKYLDNLYSLKQNNDSILEENKDFIGFEVNKNSNGNYLLTFKFKENGLDLYFYLGDIDNNGENHFVLGNNSDSLYSLFDGCEKNLFIYKLEEIKNILSSTSLYEKINYLDMISNSDVDKDVDDIESKSYPSFNRDSAKFNFFDKNRKLSGIPYTIIDLFDVLLDENKQLDNYETIYALFKKYNSIDINNIIDTLSATIIPYDDLSIVYSESEVQINKEFLDGNTKILMSLRLKRNKKIDELRVDASNLKNYSSKSMSNYLHSFCDDTLNYLDILIDDSNNKNLDSDSLKTLFDTDLIEYSISDSLSKSMFIDKPARIILANDGRFDVLTDDVNYKAPSLKSFAKISVSGYENIYTKNETLTHEQVKLINLYPDMLLTYLDGKMKYSNTENGLLLEDSFILNNKKENLNNILVLFNVLFNNKTNELNVTIFTENMRILVYFRDKWMEFDNSFKTLMEKVLPQIDILNIIYNDIEDLKSLCNNSDWELLNSFLHEFIHESIQELLEDKVEFVIDDSILEYWNELISGLKTQFYNKDNEFNNIDELDNIEPDLSFDDKNSDSMSDDDLMNLFNSLGSVDLDESSTDAIPVIQDVNMEDNLLENIDKLDEIKQVEVDTMMFLTVFDNLLNIIDSSYDSGSVSVWEDEFIISENGKEFTTTAETITRLKQLLTVDNAVKLSNVYIKLLDSIMNKGILETIVSESQIFAILNNMYEKYGKDMVNRSYRDDSSIIGIPSSDILAETLKDSGIDTNKFEFLNGVMKK